MDWILEEMRSLTLGDERLNIRAKKILSSLSKNPTDSIPTSCSSSGDMKAAYRLFDNNKASSDKIQESHFKSTISRMSAHAVVLILQDTTVLNFTGQQSRSDAEPTRLEWTCSPFHMFISHILNNHDAAIFDTNVKNGLQAHSCWATIGFNNKLSFKK